MSWTYGGDPAANDRDEVRFLVGDTVSTDPQVTDAEVAYAVAREPDNLTAAIRICRALGAKYARMPDQKIGDLSISYSQKAEAYYALAEELLVRSNSTVTAYAGGQTVADKLTDESDSNIVPPLFRRGMLENPSRGSTDLVPVDENEV